MASASKKTDNAAEIDRLALALAKEPGSKVFIPLAEEYGKAGMWEEAAVVLEDGLKIYPHFITAMVALGRVYEQVNQPVKAKAILEEAIKLSPDNLRAHRTLARLYAAEGVKDATIRSCNVILAVNPHDQEALSLRSAVTGCPTEAAGHSGAPGVEALPPEPGAVGSDGLSVRPPDGKETGPMSASASPDHHLSTGTMSTSAKTRPHVASMATLEQWLAQIKLRRRDRLQATPPLR